MGNTKKSKNIHDKLIDIELAKRDKNTKVIKYIPAIALVFSLYYFFLLALGVVLGYIGSKICSKFLLENGKVGCIYINCGKWKIHLHHWMLGTLLLLLVWLVDYLYLPRFFLGVVLGIIVHDIYDFNDWHKILVKNEA